MERPIVSRQLAKSGEGTEAVRRFVEREGDLLHRMVDAGAGETPRSVRIVDGQGTVCWSSLAGPPPDGPALEAVAEGLGARILLQPAPSSLRMRDEPWLRVLARCIDALAQMSAEISGLVEEHVALTDQLMAMLEVSRGTRSRLHLEDQLRVVVEEAVRVTDRDAGVLWISGPPEERLLVHPEESDLEAAIRRSGILDRCGSEPTPEEVRGLSGGRFQGCVTAEFRAGQARTGWLRLLTARSDRFTLAGDQKLAQAMADIAGTYVETASLQEIALENLKIGKELEIARSIQQMLVEARLSGTMGARVAAYYDPAREVGGDFYLARRIRNGRYLYALGDVAGKGVPAALLMSMTRTAAMTLSEAFDSPAQALCSMGEILFEDLDRTGKLVTLLLAHHDPAAGTIRIANAGHSPVLLARRGLPIRRLDPDFPPLGVLARIEFREEEIPFGPGDLLVVTSDGFTEARSESGDLFGVDRLAALVSAGRDLPPGELIDRIVGEVRLFAGKAPRGDDQTALVLSGREAA